MNKFIVVCAITNEGVETPYMEVVDTEIKALDYIRNLEPTCIVRRVFTVSDFGKITHYNVVFTGQLTLLPIEEEI